jgi:ribose transport system substrate-binding protein
MGYEGVKAMVAHLKGEQVQKRIDTGILVATPQNMRDPQVAERLSPDLSQWLNP